MLRCNIALAACGANPQLSARGRGADYQCGGACREQGVEIV